MLVVDLPTIDGDNTDISMTEDGKITKANNVLDGLQEVVIDMFSEEAHIEADAIDRTSLSLVINCYFRENILRLVLLLPSYLLLIWIQLIDMYCLTDLIVANHQIDIL